MDIILHKDSSNLFDIFQQRVSRTADDIAYLQYSNKKKKWQEFTWQNVRDECFRWQIAFENENLVQGDKVAIMLNNCLEWVLCDLAAQSLGLVTVPLYMNDRADNVGYILQHAETKLLFLETPRQFESLGAIHQQLHALNRIVTINDAGKYGQIYNNVIPVQNWLNIDQKASYTSLTLPAIRPDALATIVYTSGTTGKPKGVMLSHKNIISNLYACLEIQEVYTQDRLLSFLPLSHMFERCVGFYLPIAAGASVAFSRSIAQLSNDLIEIRPSLMVSVPRIFEKVFSKINGQLKKESGFRQFLFKLTLKSGWLHHQYLQNQSNWSPLLLLHPLLDYLVAAKVRKKLGGKLRFTVCGGAALSEPIARFFIALGIPILQGYGLTETSPVISANRLPDNIPASVGKPLPGVEIKIADNDELLTRSNSVMMGYWKNAEATRQVLDNENWFHTGDKARIEHDRIVLTGRIKDIIVMSNGEKISPSDMELAISIHPLFDQVMVIGEARSFLAALVVLSEDGLNSYSQHSEKSLENSDISKDKALNRYVLDVIKQQIHDFPGYAKIRRIIVCSEPWTIDNNLMTPTLKIRRNLVEAHYAAEIENIYNDL